MSAQAILSMLGAQLAAAPVDAPKAADGGGVFGGLLTGLLADTESGDGDAAPVEDASDPSAAPVAPTPIMAAANAPVAILVLEAASAALGGEVGDETEAAPEPAAAIAAAPPLPMAATPPAGGNAPAPPAPALSPLTAEPLVLPPAPVDDGAVAETGKTEGSGKPEVPATSADSPTPSPTPAAQPASPSPLRPLAERTAQSAETAPGADDALLAPAASTDSATTEAKPAANPPAKADPPATVNREAAAARRDPEAAVAFVEPGPASGAAEAMERDLSVSNLSRAAIDATAQIAARIVRQLEGRSTRFEMALLPEELGRVDVKLDIDSEGRLAARLAFDNPAAATDLRGRADELRRQLEAQGFHVADDAFEFAQRDSGSHAFDRGRDQPGGRSRAFSVSSRLNAEAEIAAVPARWTALSLSPAGVDMKV